jgi:hypothetical protein
MLPLPLPKQPNERRILTLRLDEKPGDTQHHWRSGSRWTRDGGHVTLPVPDGYIDQRTMRPLPRRYLTLAHFGSLKRRCELLAWCHDRAERESAASLRLPQLRQGGHLRHLQPRHEGHRRQPDLVALRPRSGPRPSSATLFDHAGDAAAICRIWMQRRVMFPAYKSAQNSPVYRDAAVRRTHHPLSGSPRARGINTVEPDVRLAGWPRLSGSLLENYATGWRTKSSTEKATIHMFLRCACADGNLDSSECLTQDGRQHSIQSPGGGDHPVH